ncbi:MAG: quinone-dependent dihydroorotate dehydrogenase [Rikenellaceae bacterium]|nr:quinone-dependent dihydroorotate dehydrogenase [Rikenellaceae bacterium]MCL2692416.1 quinone-dependent dihydroorotate dehydrogenase [Rikenellaceae bacterium]
MYKYFFRPLFFLFSPETIHHVIAWNLRTLCRLPGGRKFLRAIYSYRRKDLEREVFGIKFPNPIGLPAGFDKNGDLYREMTGLGFGFVEVGTVTPKAQPGNPKPRSFRLPKDRALINRMGFNNEGLENMIENLVRRKASENIVLGVNLGKNTATPNDEAPHDYLKLFRNLYHLGDYFVVNVSCPNVKDITALQNRDGVLAILEPMFAYREQQAVYRPILLKISPDLPNEEIDAMIDTVLPTPLDGIVATNTTTSRAGLHTPHAKVERLGNGGLSGAPLTQRAIEVVRRVHKRSGGRYHIIGVGGIMTPQDAQRMLDAGASLVQIFTGFIYGGPTFAKRVCKYLSKQAKR